MERLANAARMVSACKSGDLQAVQELLTIDRKLAAASNDAAGRFQPLHYAVRAGHTEIVKLLLEAGADAAPFDHMLRNHLGTTTLEIARVRGFTQIVALIESALADRYRAPLADQQAAKTIQQGDLAEIEALVRANPAAVQAVDDDGNTALHRAVQRSEGPSPLIDYLVEQGAKIDAVNALGFRPVDLALWRNHEGSSPANPRPDLVRYLAGKGAAYDMNLASALGDIAQVHAMLAGSPELVHHAGANKRRPLSCAAAFNHIEVVRVLLERGADPNAQEEEVVERYPIYLAARNNNLEMVKLLLEYGSRPDGMVDSAGNALSLALDHDNQEMVDLLMSRGVPVPTWYYSWNGKIDKVREILAKDPSQAQEVVDLANEDLPLEISIGQLEMGFATGGDPKKVGAWPLYRAAENALFWNAI
ncbi:MAG: ankyrin repeat domain-containing protein [Acidobacteriota bacterium]